MRSEMEDEPPCRWHRQAKEVATTEKTTEKILSLILENPNITTEELARVCDMTPDGVYYHTKRLREKGVYEAAEDTIFPPNGRQTHPGAKARYQNLLDNAPKPVNFDRNLYYKRIPELVSWWEEHIRKDVMENFEIYEMYGSLYLAAPNTEWRGKELIDRVDY